jgi:hypothetical protein
VISYTVTATDNVDPNPALNCAPPSGATFPVGTTTVVCTASDSSGNTATATFNVIVLAPLTYSFKISAAGSVDPKTGVAKVGGTITCSHAATMFISYGQVVQPFANRVTLVGPFSGFFQTDCSPTAASRSESAVPPDGRFGAGKAHVDVFFAGVCDTFRCLYFSRSADITLRSKR